MKYFRYEHKGSRIDLYPLVCWRGLPLNTIKAQLIAIAERVKLMYEAARG